MGGSTSQLNVCFSEGYGIVVLGITPCADTQGQAEENSNHSFVAGHRTPTTPLDTYSGIMRSEGKDLLREYWIMCIYDTRCVFSKHKKLKKQQQNIGFRDERAE